MSALRGSVVVARKAARKPAKTVTPGPPEAPGWTFLTNHTHVLLCLTRDPQPPLREVAQLVGITERSVQRIVADLEEGGYVVRRRSGRRNTYEIRRGIPLRHPIEVHRRIGDLIELILES